MRKLLLLFIVIFFSTNTFAKENPFLKIPFGWQMGVTTNDEIEKRGVCLEQIEVRSNYFRCKRYNIKNVGQITSSQNETAVIFYINDTHRLPRSWKKADVSWGMQLGHFKFFLNVMDDVEYPEIKEYMVSGNLHWGYTVEFDSGSHHFKLTFKFEDYKNKYNPNLRRIEISEAY